MQGLINVASGCLARVHDNTWGEIDGSGADGLIKIWTTGAGKVITQRGRTPQDASLDFSVEQGANDSNVVGIFAAATA